MWPTFLDTMFFDLGGSSSHDAALVRRAMVARSTSA
jgi:hypothetical protein